MSIFLTIISSLLDSIFVKKPHHTSILTGEAWIIELIASHLLCILCQLCVWHHVEVLITTRHELGLNKSQHMSLEEQLVIFPYSFTTGLSWWTLSEIRDLPTESDPCPPQIHENMKLYLYFKDVLGTLDVTHLDCMPPVYMWMSLQGCNHPTLSLCKFIQYKVPICTEWVGGVGNGHTCKQGCIGYYSRW
jgi:hypothetical protein